MAVKTESIGESAQFQAQFQAYVQEVFSGGFYFSGLNYPNFSQLLYDPENLRKKTRLAVLAASLLPFTPEKEAFGKRFRIADDTASYEFGPVCLDPDTGTEAVITFDEWVAVAWKNDVRFGIIADAVRDKIKFNYRGVVVVARASVPVKGKDARLEYLLKIDKDLTPAEDAKTGRMDLRHYKCTFPEISDMNRRKIIRKINAVPGTPGYRLNGKIIPPPDVADYDLKTLCGEGTAQVMEGETEYLIAQGLGYIVVDPRSNKISVTPEAQNHLIIGPETGSLVIKSEEFLQFNDILSGYCVECRNINVKKGDVNGEIISSEGFIDVEGNVNSGRLTALNGDIQVKGFVTMNSRIECLKGEIRVSKAENSLLIGRRIFVQSAVNCLIVGEEINVGTVQSSKLAGLSVSIDLAQSSGTKGENTQVVIPILDVTDKRMRVFSGLKEEKEVALADVDRKIAKLKESNVLVPFLDAVKAKNEAAINALRRYALPVVNEINKLTQEAEGQKEEVGKIDAKLILLTAEHERNIQRLEQTQQCAIEKAPQEPVVMKIYGGLDWPLSFEELGAVDGSAYRNFMALVNHLTVGFGNSKRKGWFESITEPCRYDHAALLKLYEKAEIIDGSGKAWAAPSTAGPGEVRENRATVVSGEDFRHFLTERKWPPGRMPIDVSLDGIFKGFINDFSTGELSIFLEKKQKWRPSFDRGEKVKISGTVQGNEVKYEFIVAYITDKGDYFKVGGHFINIDQEEENKLYVLKNRYEVLRKSFDSSGS